MPSISLTLPTAGTVITAGLHATNYTSLQSLLNGGLDTSNWAVGKIFPPSKLTQEAAVTGQGLVWNKTGASTWVPAGTLVQLFDSILGADTASFDITSIDGSYAHLRLILYARGDAAGVAIAANVRFNNDSGANYSDQKLQGFGATVTAVENIAATQMRVGRAPGASAPANAFGALVCDIPHYAGVTNHKHVTAQSMSREGTTTGTLIMENGGGVWFAAPAAVNRITVLPGSGNFKAGSRCTLYGVS